MFRPLLVKGRSSHTSNIRKILSYGYFFYTSFVSHSESILLVWRIDLWNFLSSPHGSGYPKLAKRK